MKRNLVQSMRHRFHILGIPHTITTPEYNSCAFTQKVVKLCKMLKQRGHYVIHYGHEDSVVECDEHVTVTTREDLARSYGDHDWRTQGFPDFRREDHVYSAFYANAISAIQARKERHDFLLCSFGGGHQAVADEHKDMIVCEPGIGYAGGYFAPFKVFESYAILHAYLGLGAVARTSNSMWYDVVIPNYFDLDEFEFSAEKDDYFLFLGRVYSGKGIHIAVQIVEEVGGRLMVAGPGKVEQYMALTSRPVTDYVTYVGVADTQMRKRLMSRAKAMLLPSTFLEPFCGVQVESMLSGTPIVTNDYGAFAEINLHGVTGFRCRTFEQFVWAARNVGSISPRACRDWAVSNYSIERVGDMYEDYFETVKNVFIGKGWYQLNDGRTDLDWLRRYYPEDPALHGPSSQAIARTAAGSGGRGGPSERSAPLKLLPAHFEELVRPFWVPTPEPSPSSTAAPTAADAPRRALAPFITGKGREDVLAAARSLARGGTIVEVGTYKGEFAAQLCSACEPVKMYCVDPYLNYPEYKDIGHDTTTLDPVYDEARARMARFGDRVEFLRTFSSEAAPKFADESLDCIYLDGNHTYRFVYQDLCLWYPKMRPGALVCGDDAVDGDEHARDAEGDVEIVWERNTDGSVRSGGHYGVLKALRQFCQERSLEFHLSGFQFLFLKPDRA